MSHFESEFRTGVYEQGYDPQSRSLAECEKLWNRGLLMAGTFDELLTAQLDLALSQGRTAVNVLDLGSGTGALIRNVVNDSGLEGSRTFTSRKILSQNPGLGVRITGLTDAEFPEDMFRREEIIPSASYTIPHHTSAQIRAENFYYSVTEEQRVSQFLRGIDMPKVDLILSTWFFAHLPKGVFEKALLDTTQALNPGGKLVIFGYHSKSRRLLDQLKAISDDEARQNPQQFQEAMMEAFDLLTGAAQGPDPDRVHKEVMIARLGDILQEDIRSSADEHLALIERPLVK